MKKDVHKLKKCRITCMSTGEVYGKIENYNFDPPRKSSNNPFKDERLNSIIANLIDASNSKFTSCKELHTIHKSKSKTTGLPFIQSQKQHIKFINIEKLEHLNVKFSESNNLVVLTFDYFSRSSFDFVIDTINSQILIENIRIICVGLKYTSSSISDKTISIDDKSYEVNEDFARLAFFNLGIDYFTLKTEEMLSKLERLAHLERKHKIDDDIVDNHEDDLIFEAFFKF